MALSRFMQEETYTRVDIIKRCRRKEFFIENWADIVATLEEYKEAGIELLMAGIPTAHMGMLLTNREEHVAWAAYIEMLRRELVPSVIPPEPKGIAKQVVYKTTEKPTVKARIHIGAGTPTSEIAEINAALEHTAVVEIDAVAEAAAAADLAKRLAAVPLPNSPPKPVPNIPYPIAASVAKATNKSSGGGGMRKGTKVPISIAGVSGL